MRLALIGVLALVTLAGCGTRVEPGAPAGPPAASNTSPGACAQFRDLTQDDNGTTVCLALGGDLSVSLQGAPGQEWAQPRVTPAEVLRSTPLRYSGPPDTLAWAYTAAAAGTADITSSRSACPPPAPGSAACHAQQAFRVSVTVR
jgi:hypothetical protein